MSILKGRRAFVTGAAKGIGAAIARRLSAEGAEVVIVDRNVDLGEALAREIGNSARAIKLDVSDIEAMRSAVRDTGPFDILVNNAGKDQHCFFTKSTVEEWRMLLGVNLDSVLASTHAALPAMQAKRYGRIVNIVSEAGRLGSKGGSVYAASKGAVIAFTKSIARENAHFGITANCIAPGPVETPLLLKAVEQGGDKLLQAMRTSTLVGRLGTPDEVAAAVAYFASEQAGFTTGETLGVSGGMYCA